MTFWARESCICWATASHDLNVEYCSLKLFVTSSAHNVWRIYIYINANKNARAREGRCKLSDYFKPLNIADFLYSLFCCWGACVCVLYTRDVEEPIDYFFWLFIFYSGRFVVIGPR